MTSLLRNLRSDDTGSALVESAISLTCMLMIFFGVMDCSRALYADVYVGFAAQSATRYAMVRGSTFASTACSSPASASCDATAANILSYVKSIAPVGVDPSLISVSSSWPGTTASGSACFSTNGSNSPGCLVKVSLTYSFSFVLPFLPRDVLPFQTSSAVTIAQ